MTDMTPTQQASVGEVFNDLLIVAQLCLALSMSPKSDGIQILVQHGFQFDPAEGADWEQAVNFVNDKARAAIARATSIPNEANHE